MSIPVNKLLHDVTNSNAKNAPDSAATGAGSEQSAAPVGENERTDFPCSVAQERFWLLDRLDPGNSAYNVAVRWRLEGRVLTDVLEAALLTGLLVALPPVLSGGVYFVFWHSLQHVLRMNQLMDRAQALRGPGLGAQLRFFLRRAAPLLLVSVAGLAVLYGVAWARHASGSVLVSLALLAASVVTLPHALLVTFGLDAARWRRPAA